MATANQRVRERELTPTGRLGTFLGAPVPPPIRRRTALAAGGLLAGAALVACQVIAGLELPSFVEGEGGPLPDVTTPDGAVPLPIECDPRLPPRPPRTSSTASEYYFAVEFFDFGAPYEGDAGVTRNVARLCRGVAGDGGAILDPAIDLDGVTTCAELPDGGRVANPCTSRAPVCDPLANGGDNNGLEIGTFAFGSSTNEASDPNFVILRGEASLLLRVTNYNGEDDDSEVAAALIQGVGLARGGKLVAPDSGVRPAFDGTDEWVATSASFNELEKPALETQGAYVAGGVLVASFKKAKVSFGGSGTDLEADELIVTARVVRDGANPVRLDRGRLAARIPVGTLWNYVRGRSIGGLTVCDSASFRDTAVSSVCQALDLSASPGSSCDAISFAAGFYAGRAKLAPFKLKSPEAGLPGTCEGKPLVARWPPKDCDDLLDSGSR